MNLWVLFGVLAAFFFSGCNPLYNLPNPTLPLSEDSLDDLVSLTSKLGYVPSYTTNGEGAGLLSGAGFGFCVVMRSGNIKCWGYNSNGQLGTGNTTNMDTPTLASVLTNISIANGDFAVAVSASLMTTCAYFKSGLKCWGDNSNGQFGTGNTTSSLIPVPVSNVSDKKMAGFAAGDVHSCASYTDGSMGCWGTNTSGQLGDGTLNQSLGGVSPNVSEKIISASASDKMTCVATASRKGICWGNALGYLGFTFSQNPTAVVSGATSASRGNGAHMCFLIDDQTVQCFGNNVNGQLGNASTVTTTGPVSVNGLTSVGIVVAGQNHSCAANNNFSTIYCWGDNSVGQLGIGSTTSYAIPKKVTGLPNQTIVDMAASDKVNCALLANDDVYCWGDNNSTATPGPLGIAKSTPFSPSATKILNRADP